MLHYLGLENLTIQLFTTVFKRVHVIAVKSFHSDQEGLENVTVETKVCAPQSFVITEFHDVL